MEPGTGLFARKLQDEDVVGACGSAGMQMKILWVGPFFSDVALQSKKAANQAAAKWSRGLLRGLERIGCEIRVIDHVPNQRWPKGNVFWQDNDKKWFLDWYPCERVSYLNVCGVKQKWLKWCYVRAAKRIFRDWCPDVVLCYNSLHSFNVAVMEVASRQGIRCVPIILDGDDPRRDNWRKLLRDNRFADGVVFLSWWMYKNYPRQEMPLFHMDGGADMFKGTLPPLANVQSLTTIDYRSTHVPYVLVHTGALDYWRGLDFMKEVVRICKRTDVRFVLCGKCDRDRMWAEFDNDRRVEVKGFVSDAEVDEIWRMADVFLNVRTPGLGGNLVNYPSKIPNYLSWGKPVVSTWNDSFSPEYRSLLEVTDDTPEGFVRVLDEVLSWNNECRRAKYAQIRSWFVEWKSWSRQTERLVTWLRSV